MKRVLEGADEIRTGMAKRSLKLAGQRIGRVRTTPKDGRYFRGFGGSEGGGCRRIHHLKRHGGDDIFAHELTDTGGGGIFGVEKGGAKSQENANRPDVTRNFQNNGLAI